MAGKFVELKEAAQLLGMSPDELIEARSHGEIHGYRDGASWKFKLEEVQRYAEEQGITLGGAAASEELIQVPGLLSDADDQAEDAEEDSASILVSEQELGDSGEGTSSTVIGSSEGKALADSDLRLAVGDSALAAGGEEAASGSDKRDSDVELVAEEDKSGGSDVKVVAGSGSDVVLGDSDAELQAGSSGGTGELDLEAGGSSGSDLGLGSDELDLGEDDEVELALTDEDDELVLGGGMGSDVTLGGSDTGINLTSPSDSGLSLEDEPLELGSSVSSLELPEDEDVISLDEAEADPDAATQLKQDEEFLLSSPAEAAEEEDSGSQVIALEDSEAFETDAATLVQEGEPALMTTEAAVVGEAELEAMETPAVVPGAPMPAVGPAVVSEAPYSIWNVLGLLLIVAVLGLTGTIMMDVVRNMWSWEGATSISTSLTDLVVGAFGLD